MSELNEKRSYGNQIIDLLQEQGFSGMNQQIKNTIQLIIHETFEKGKEFGIKEGKNIGINMACKELEAKIKSMTVSV